MLFDTDEAESLVTQLVQRLDGEVTIEFDIRPINTEVFWIKLTKGDVSTVIELAEEKMVNAFNSPRGESDLEDIFRYELDVVGIVAAYCDTKWRAFYSAMVLERSKTNGKFEQGGRLIRVDWSNQVFDLWYNPVSRQVDPVGDHRSGPAQ